MVWVTAPGKGGGWVQRTCNNQIMGACKRGTRTKTETPRRVPLPGSVRRSRTWSGVQREQRRGLKHGRDNRVVTPPLLEGGAKRYCANLPRFFCWPVSAAGPAAGKGGTQKPLDIPICTRVRRLDPYSPRPVLPPRK